jgi:hypothetical protein
MLLKHHVIKAAPRMNPYAAHSHAAQLRTVINTHAINTHVINTHLAAPRTPFWASCDVVVRRGRNASGLAGRRRAAAFCVVLSREELQSRNECLWREVTARVPFAEWAGHEVMRKDWNFGRRRVHREEQWRPHTDTYESEDAARDNLFGLQHDIVRAADRRAAGGSEEWTLVVHAR